MDFDMMYNCHFDTATSTVSILKERGWIGLQSGVGYKMSFGSFYGNYNLIHNNTNSVNHFENESELFEI